MAKRKNGEGSYGKRTINGTEYFYYQDPNKHVTYAKTSKELQEKLKKKKAEQQIPVGENIKATLKEYCEEWLKQVAKRDITQRTYDDYESIIKNRIGNYAIADVELRSLSVNMINNYLDQLAGKYSRGSIDKVWTVLRQVINYGMEEDDIPKMNLNKIRLPQEREVAVKKKEIPCPTPSDIEELYQESLRKGKGGKYYGDGAKVIVFIMYSGLRISEAIGLRWKYVAKDLSSIKVAESTVRVKVRDKSGESNGQYQSLQKDPKTVNGIREVPLPDRACEILKYFNQIPHKEDDFVFLTANKTPFGKRAVERTLESMLNHSKCECKEYTPHTLRHAYGSILIQRGVPVATVSKLLGHGSVDVTTRVYYHLLKDETAEQIKNVFDGEK